MEENVNIQNREQIKNPYTKENRAEYKIGVWEQFLRSLGLRTGYDNYQMDMDNLERQWDTQNQSLSYEENYNSPEAQTARMRQAGLNPDINGEVTGGQASEMAESELPPTSGVDEAQLVGNFTAKLGTTLIDILTKGVAGYASMKNLKLAEEKQNSEIELKEDNELRESAMKALYDFGADDEYENGAYIGHIKGFSGKRLEKFSKYYDELYRSYPKLIAQNEQEKEAKNTAFENQITDSLNNVKETMAKAQLKAAQILNEENRRKIEFLKNHPEYNEAETDMLIKQGNKEAIEYRNISLETQSQLDELNTNAITDYETFLSKYNYWNPRLHWRYNRARKRIGAKGVGINLGPIGISD